MRALAARPDCGIRYQLFTTYEKYLDWAKNCKADILIVSKDIYERCIKSRNDQKIGPGKSGHELNQNDSGKDCAELIILCDDADSDSNDEGVCVMDKYSSVSSIYDFIRERARQNEGNKKGKCHVNGVFSMKGGEDAFNLSLMLVDIEASEAKTLFVNFDEFVPDSILPLVGDNSISDLIYYFRLNQDILKEKINDFIGHYERFDYIAASPCASDIEEISISEVKDILTYLSDKLSYSRIVVNISGLIRKPWLCFDAFEKIYMPLRDRYYDYTQQNIFETFLENIGMDSVLKQVVKVETRQEDVCRYLYGLNELRTCQSYKYLSQEENRIVR